MTHRKSKSQVSVEFVTVLGILLMIFMITAYVVYMKYVRTADLKVYVDGLMVVTSIADNINTVNMVGDGYWTKFTIPAKLYAFSDYNISFYPSESTVFIHGSGFSRSAILYFSAPISTKRVDCYLKQCNGLCNRTTEERCILVNESIRTRVLRQDGRLFFTEEYNLVQPDLRELIVPYEGFEDGYLASSSIAGSALIPGTSVVYVYKDLDKNRLDLVVRHNVTDLVRMDFHDIMGVLERTVSDDELPLEEFNMSSDPEGNWNPRAGDLDGGMMVFNSTGFRLCITPIYMPPGVDWVWLNGDGSKYSLDDENEVCITYP